MSCESWYRWDRVETSLVGRNEQKQAWYRYNRAGRCKRWEDWAGDKDVNRGILVISTPRQGRKELRLELELEQGGEAMW